jgi:large subunit ribosomal protein L21
MAAPPTAAGGVLAIFCNIRGFGHQSAATSGAVAALSAPLFPLVKGPALWNFPGSFPKAMAYAIIKTGGRQYRVAEGDTIDVDLLSGEAGDKLTFDDVLLHADGDEFAHGDSVSGATVTGEVVEQRKDKKVVAFKYRRRKGYHRTVGHRRKLTRVRITGITLGASKAKKTTAEKEAAA